MVYKGKSQSKMDDERGCLHGKLQMNEHDEFDQKYHRFLGKENDECYGCYGFTISICRAIIHSYISLHYQIGSLDRSTQRIGWYQMIPNPSYYIEGSQHFLGIKEVYNAIYIYIYIHTLIYTYSYIYIYTPFFCHFPSGMHIQAHPCVLFFRLVARGVDPPWRPIHRTASCSERLGNDRHLREAQRES